MSWAEDSFVVLPEASPAAESASSETVKTPTACHQPSTSGTATTTAAAIPKRASSVSFHISTLMSSKDSNEVHTTQKANKALSKPQYSYTTQHQDPLHGRRSGSSGTASVLQQGHTSSTKTIHANVAAANSSRISHEKNGKLTLSAFRRSAVRLTRADPRQRLEDYYEMKQNGPASILGHGAFSTVRMAIRKADQLPVAIKSIAKHEALRARRVRVGKHSREEWDILKEMRGHPFVVQLLEVFETEDEIILVLEYCKGGELFNAIQRRKNRKQAMRRGQYTESQAAVITSQMLKALADLHAAGIVHRDVKPENILLTESNDDRIRVKLCDFGMARCLKEDDSSEMGSGSEDASPSTPGRSRAYSIVGSNYYAAPEIFYGNPYDSAVDIYSLGVTLHILLCGCPPCFTGPNSQEVVFPNSYWVDISQDAKSLVQKMLHQNPLERITAREALRDKWIWQHLQYHKHRPSVLRPRVARFASPERCTNLDAIRNQLYQNLTLQASMKRGGTSAPPAMSLSPPKRRRNNSRSSSAALLALADLYRDVAQSPAAKALSVNAEDVARAPTTPTPDVTSTGLQSRPSSSHPLSV